jgi:hypothetical protein
MHVLLKGATSHVRHVSDDIPKSCLLAGSHYSEGMPRYKYLELPCCHRDSCLEIVAGDCGAGERDWMYKCELLWRLEGVAAVKIELQSHGMLQPYA